MAIISVESKTFQDLQEYQLIKLMNDQSVDETTSDAVEVSMYKDISLYIESGTGVSGGVVTLEGAMSSDYAGAWVSYGTLTTAAASTAYLLSLSERDSTTKVGLPVKYIRARISTVISGGTIDVYLMIRR